VDDAQLEKALAIHEAAYGLLKWLGGAIDRGFVALTTAHRYASDAESAAAWIAEHFENIPPECRPAARRGDDLRRFANYFASYLRCSFEFRHDSGTRRVSACGCYCDFCAYVEAAPNLKPAAVLGRDKRRADERKRQVLERLARAEEVALVDGAAAVLLKDDALRRHLASVAYAEQLVERCEGRASDRSALALWRQFAWEGHAPRRGYRLTVGAIRESERRVREAIVTTGTRSGPS
jgi:hypothetical protein